MDSKDVEEIFKGVLTEESQSSHEPMITEVTNNSVTPNKYALNTSPAIVPNQHGVIIQQSPSSVMPPSHSGEIFFVYQANIITDNRAIPVTL